MGRVAFTDAWKNTARLYGVIAPGKRTAVLLRRGPSLHVRMILWDLNTDEFTPGQWLKHRVYERRCDLSPGGRHFIYFAGGYGKKVGTYTAVSRPPYFTALSLWQKGDAWGGGGLFADGGRKILLNHRPEPYFENFDEMAVFEGFEDPPLTVVPLHEHSGWGEDDPICHYRMIRDGWTIYSKGSEFKSQGFEARYHYARRKPVIYEKRSKSSGGRLQWALHMSSKFIGEHQGRWNVEEASIVDRRRKTVLDLGRIDWCDLDRNGDILWAWAGKLWRMKSASDPRAFRLRQPDLLGDFNDMTFENIKAPASARCW